ncbi:ATP-binding protein [Peptoniphilus catoniae]|uniref:ATP-binding protein n=1 Tax=Peptoniphilus catoniae TaxID=1660341 RepID=UPI0010FDF519|nr:ATP-binding protein [Peptoniphilus catoniae]
MKEVYRKIEKEYEMTRDSERDALEERKAEIYEKIPQIKKIDELIVNLALSGSKEQIKAPSSESLLKINQDLYELREEKLKILQKYGYSKDYLDIRYKCLECRDTGYLENGQKCDCMKVKLSKELYEMSNISYILGKENFDTFDLGIFSREVKESEGISPRENMELILKAVRKFIYGFNEKNDMNLLFYGPTGQGKTFLLNCIAKELIDKNFGVIYQTAFNLLDVMEDRKFRRSEITQAKYDLLFSCDLLAIDDLGIELVNSFSASEIFNVVNTRILRGKKTLISTNLSPDELSRTYTNRVFSRVYQRFVPLKFFGDDLRLKIN